MVIGKRGRTAELHTCVVINVSLETWEKTWRGLSGRRKQLYLSLSTYVCMYYI
jgi:hypothetical protein